MRGYAEMDNADVRTAIAGLISDKLLPELARDEFKTLQEYYLWAVKVRDSLDVNYSALNEDNQTAKVSWATRAALLRDGFDHVNDRLNGHSRSAPTVIARKMGHIIGELIGLEITLAQYDNTYEPTLWEKCFP